MSFNEITNDKVKSTLIKVETLQKEYEVILQQYQESVQNYITLLESNKTNKFVALKGRTWWGTNKLNEGTVNNQEECENMCINSEKCSGATFNPVKRYCWTRSGENNITPGLDNDYALISKDKSILLNMKYLNDKLLVLNKKITDELTNINPEVEKEYKEKDKKKEELNNSYNRLLEQKIELEKQLDEYYSIEQEENNQYLYVNQQNMSFKMWICIAIIVVLIIIEKFVITSLPISITIWFIIFMFIIMMSYSLRSPVGFLIWFVLLVIIVIIKSK